MDFCLKDYIGLRFCDTDCSDSESGLFINSLPGLSIESIDNTANQEQVSYKGVWADVQDEAWAQFEIDFYNEVANCHDIDRNTDLKKLLCQNKKVLANAWRFCLGVQLMLVRIYTSRINFFTLDDKEANDLKNLYQQNYEEALTKSCKLLNVKSVHLTCAPKDINTVTWLP